MTTITAPTPTPAADGEGRGTSVQAAAASLVRHLTVALNDKAVAEEVLGADPSLSLGSLHSALLVIAGKPDMGAMARDHAVAALGSLMANPDAAAATCAPSAVSQLVKALSLEITATPSSAAALELLCLSRALAHQAGAAETMVSAGTLDSLQRIFSLAQAGTAEPAMVIEATITLQVRV